MSDARHTDDGSDSTDYETTAVPVRRFTDGLDGETPDVRAFMPRLTYSRQAALEGLSDGESDGESDGDTDLTEAVGMTRESLESLCESLESGQEQPVVAREADDGLEVIAGFRRVMAVAMNVMGQFDGSYDVSTVDTVIRDYSDTEAARSRFSENHFRESVSETERARLLYIIKEKNGYSHADTADYVGKSRSWVSQRLKLLELPTELQERIDAGSVDPLVAARLHREFGSDPDADDDTDDTADDGGDTDTDTGDGGDTDADDGDGGNTDMPDDVPEPDTPDLTDAEAEALDEIEGLSQREQRSKVEERADAVDRIKDIEGNLSTIDSSRDLIETYEERQSRIEALSDEISEVEERLDALWADVPDKVSDDDLTDAVTALQETRGEVTDHRESLETVTGAVEAVEGLTDALRTKAEDIDPQGTDRYERLKTDRARLKNEVGDTSFHTPDGETLHLTISGLDLDTVLCEGDDGHTRIDADAVGPDALSEFLAKVQDYQDADRPYQALDADARTAQAMQDAARDAPHDLSKLESVSDQFDTDTLADSYGADAVERLQQAISNGESVASLEAQASDLRAELESLEAEADDLKEAQAVLDDVAPEIRDLREKRQSLKDERARLNTTQDGSERSRSFAQSIENRETTIRKAKKAVLEDFAELSEERQHDLLAKWRDTYDFDLSWVEHYVEAGEWPEELRDDGDDGDDDADDADDGGDLPARDDLAVTTRGGGYYQVTDTVSGTVMNLSTQDEQTAEAAADVWASSGPDAVPDDQVSAVETPAE